MIKDDIIKALTEIYDRRLQSLIGYSQTSCTQEIAEYMLNHFNTLSSYSKNEGFELTPYLEIYRILAFLPGSKIVHGSEAETSSDKMTRQLEAFIMSSYDLLYPTWNADGTKKADAYRRAFGSRFKEELKAHPKKYPEQLKGDSFFSQLNHTTQFRNKLSHPVVGYSGFYNRHIILQSYDILLTYLLYTFYYLALSNYPFKNLVS